MLLNNMNNWLTYLIPIIQPTLGPDSLYNNPYNNNPSGGGGGANPYMGYAQAGVTVATGALEMDQGIKARINEYRDMDVSVQGQQFEDGYKPTYNLGDDIQKLSNLRTDQPNVGKGMVGANIAKGATTGFSAGAATMNPWGMAIGTVAGAIGGLFAGIFGKEKAKDEHEKKLGALEANVQRGQDRFNQANESYYNAIEGKSIFNLHEQRKQNRYNIPSFNSLY